MRPVLSRLGSLRPPLFAPTLTAGAGRVIDGALIFLLSPGTSSAPGLQIASLDKQKIMQQLIIDSNSTTVARTSRSELTRRKFRWFSYREGLSGATDS